MLLDTFGTVAHLENNRNRFLFYVVCVVRFFLTTAANTHAATAATATAAVRSGHQILVVSHQNLASSAHNSTDVAIPLYFFF